MIDRYELCYKLTVQTIKDLANLQFSIVAFVLFSRTEAAI